MTLRSVLVSELAPRGIATIAPMPATATKIRVARAVSATLLRLGFRSQRRVRRNGIAFELDLREGIDLSLFLFGSFQRNVIGSIRMGRTARLIFMSSLRRLTMPCANILAMLCASIRVLRSRQRLAI